MNNFCLSKVKRRLDYLVELDNLKRTVQQRHMINWLNENVLISEHEKQIFQKCMVNLKACCKRIIIIHSLPILSR